VQIRRKLVVPMAVGLIALAAGGGAYAALTRNPAPTPQSYARRLLQQPASRFMSAPARSALVMMADGDLRYGAAPVLGGEPVAEPTEDITATSTLRVRRTTAISAPDNVRVNHPGTDSQLDQTTQSETTIAVDGQHVVVGYNDSAQTLLALTAATNLSGYSYSSDGGSTWTDGGTIPNHTAMMNIGDPWLTSTPDGTMYYSTLMLDFRNFTLNVGVARSTDGGASWSMPTQASPNPSRGGFYFGDKPAITSGPTPDGGTALYDAWDDFFCSRRDCGTGLPVARSTDGGDSWQVTYAARSSFFDKGCSFSQYIGAQPLVDPANGTLYVAAEKIGRNDPKCNGAPVSFSEVLFTSTDGGLSFSSGRRISDVAPAFRRGALKLGPGQLMRTIEFPSLALKDGVLYVAWNDGRLTGHSHILLADSANGGATWNLRFVTQGVGDEVQPAITADDDGLHLLYYQRTGSTLDVYEADATDIDSWTARRISSESSPGVPTFPQFDPIIAWGYMGDYIANTTDGTKRYLAWGDNRDVVTNVLWPQGRNDPNVYFAKS
jgi:hypothetical protein